MINRIGRMRITSELYLSDKIDEALYKLGIKVIRIEYSPVLTNIDIWFVSPYAEENIPGEEIPEYNILADQDGYTLKRL